MYPVPPVLMLAAIGTGRAAALLREWAQSGPRWMDRVRAGHILACLLALHVAVAAPSLYWHVRTLRENSAIEPPIREAATFVRTEASGRHPVVAADDVQVPFHADGWYVPIHR